MKCFNSLDSTSIVSFKACSPYLIISLFLLLKKNQYQEKCPKIRPELNLRFSQPPNNNTLN